MITPFFDNLIDDFGIWQHSDGEKILEREGYALDDAARGLIACLALKKTREAEVLFSYIKNAQVENGFYGFANKEKEYIAYPASEDATGQSLWAMGYSISKRFHDSEARALVGKALDRVDDFKNVRGYAYALLGMIYIDKKLSKNIANKLIKFFDGASEEWFWPETSITYGNGIIPYALLRYAAATQDDSTASLALKSLEFLHNKCRSNRLLGPIGNNGWLSIHDKTIPTYSQQPIDSAYMVWVWLAAFIYYGREEYYQNALDWMNWFNGSNVLGVPMYNLKTLKAYDGIDKDGINYHSGAEANITLLLSMHMLENKTTL